MAIPYFRNVKIRAKLVSITLFLVLLPLLGVAYLSMDRFDKAIRGASDEDLGHLVTNVYSMCKVQQEMAQMKVASDLSVAKEILYLHGRQVEILPDEKVHFDARDQFTGEHHPVKVPLWKIGNMTLTRDNHLVDEVRKLVGGTCTIFQRIQGNHLLRISTNVIAKDGKRAIGTFIPPYSPVAEALLAGRAYKGRAYVVDDWYIAAYEPIKDPKGVVIGAIYVGIREQSARSLAEEIKRIKVGDSGYVYIIDSKGSVKVHPEREGQNLVDSKDASGLEYIHAIIDESIGLPAGTVGTIRFKLADPELERSTPKEVINKFTYFKPWDWIIIAGAYEEEVYRSLHETERFILIIVLAGLALVFVLTVTLSKVLTRPIQELTEVTTKMLGGDLSQRVKVQGDDEIGVLGKSFNRMITQIQHYTSNLEKMVDARTRELKVSREKYRDLSRFLNSILDSATEYAIMALDFHGNIIEFNKGAEKLFGWQKDEVINKENIRITICPEDRRRRIQEQMSKRTRTEGVCELNMDRVRKNGERFPAHTTITAIMDPSDKTVGFVEIIRDLTRRKILEKELWETKDFLENIMESSVDGIVTTDLKGKVSYMNRAMEDLLGFDREEVLGTHISRFYRKGIDQARDIMKVLQTEERAENYEMEVMNRGGRAMPIRTSLFLVRDEDGQVIGTSGIFKDISQQKLLEAELKAAQARLVEASKMRALGELVAGVAHELNNPLMASKSILYVLVNSGQLDGPLRERLELIGKCNDRIEKIVEHLREFSRQTDPEFQKIDINRPIENALMITGQQLLNHNISLERKLSEGLPKIMGDSNQLEQVFLNLISNARDAMDSLKGVRELRICSYSTEDKGSPSVVVSVKDTGMGIPEEHLDKVFEPFFTTKPVGKGTGLGLSLCFGIIEAHRGRFEIESQPGKGTEVRVILPVKETEKE
jgi:PAS domain S-box-containing protein